MTVGGRWESPPKATWQAGELILLKHPLRLAESCVTSSFTRTLLYPVNQFGASDKMHFGRLNSMEQRCMLPEQPTMNDACVTNTCTLAWLAGNPKAPSSLHRCTDSGSLCRRLVHTPGMGCCSQRSARKDRQQHTLQHRQVLELSVGLPGTLASTQRKTALPHQSLQTANETMWKGAISYQQYDLAQRPYHGTHVLRLHREVCLSMRHSRDFYGVESSRTQLRHSFVSMLHLLCCSERVGY